MPKIYSNGLDKDFVINPLNKLISNSKSAYLAVPYFTLADPLLEALKLGISIQLIVGLNPVTNPKAIAQLTGRGGISIRFFTNRFHAKIYLFDNGHALLGSSNLTDGGMFSNREATIHLDGENDAQAMEETRALFAELWETAHVLTPDKLLAFRLAYDGIDRRGQSPDSIIETAVGSVMPTNIHVSSQKKSNEKIFLKELQTQIYEQYGPAFFEVGRVLEDNKLRRQNFSEFSVQIEVNRFLNWVRLTYAPKEADWQTAAVKSASDREKEIIKLGKIWQNTDENKVYHEYFDNIKMVQHVFASVEAIDSANKEDITAGLLCTHAFLEQLRFVKGGESALPAEFWRSNFDDIKKIKSSLKHLIYGPGDFVQRFHDILYDKRRKIALFGYFCALELFGTVRPDMCPPVNGRMAKSLRFLGYNVRPR